MASQLDAIPVLRGVLGGLEKWALQCHAASIHIVKSGVVEPARVARGSCKGVGGQHSWVVLGEDCYDEDATIIDPTLWSYDKSVEGIWVGTMRDGRHTPFGMGSIFEWGRPENAVTGQEIVLSPREPWSGEAEAFLELLGPLDRRGWGVLAHAPVQGWPAGEIITAMYDDPRVAALVPVDIVGMVTNRNPSGLYLITEEDQ